MPESTLYILDTMSHVFRAFYAVRRLNAPDGAPVNAVFGLAAMIRKLLEKRRPDYFLAAADPGGPTHRHLRAAEYKAHRKPVPEELVQQIPLCFELLEAFGIPVLVKPGYEADDVIARVAREARDRGVRTVVYTSDKDIFQLVGDGITVDDTRAEKEYGPAEVQAKLGVRPDQVVDYLALTGDDSDNIPGAPGIGPKTAVELLSRFGSLDACFENLEEVPSPRIREILRANRDVVMLSRELATLVPAAPPDWTWDAVAPFVPRWEKVDALVRRLGFRSLIPWVQAQGAAPVAPAAAPSAEAGGLFGGEGLLAGVAPIAGMGDGPWPGVTVSADGPGHAILAPCRIGDAHGLEAELSSAAGGVVGAVRTADGRVCLRLEGREDAFLADPAAAAPLLGRFFENGGRLRSRGLKGLFHLMPSLEAFWGSTDDLGLMHYLLHPDRDDHTLPRLAFDLAGVALPPDPQTGGGKTLPGMADERPGHAAMHAGALHLVAGALGEELAAAGLAGLYRDMELPLVPVLSRMERRGIRLDLDWLGNLSREMDGRLRQIEAAVRAMADEDFNLNSPVQLGRILFEKLGLALPGKQRKTKKTGRYATGADVLEMLAPLHPMPEAVLRFRHLSKLRSTYVDVLPRLADENGRVHTTFHQDVTATGRLSSANPNLQNIPVRTPEGREIRKAFVASPGCVLLCADYSQIELRVMAHLSGDEGLKGVFARGGDIHADTARYVFGPRYDADPKEYRRRAKAINYGILYGQSDFGLSEGLGINRRDAGEVIAAYFQAFPRVREWLDANLESARRTGQVRTLFGRVRPLPDLQSADRNIRLAAERMASNAPVQGAAADIMKLAMLRLEARRQVVGADLRPLLQVHDELVVECPEGDAEFFANMLKESMEGAADLAVPLVADVGSGKDWLGAKD